MRPDSAVPRHAPSGTPPLTAQGDGPGRVVLSADDLARAWRRVAHEVIESNRGGEGLVVLGIPSRGVPLAERLAAQLASLTGTGIPSAPLDVRPYRDDRDRARQSAPSPAPPQLPQGLDVEGATVVLVDDVLHSGRTARAALDAVSALGRPRAVRLAVAVDRGHRELPIRADHVGKNLPTSTSERVQVLLAETDGTDEVRITGGER